MWFKDEKDKSKTQEREVPFKVINYDKDVSLNLLRQKNEHTYGVLTGIYPNLSVQSMQQYAMQYPRLESSDEEKEFFKDSLRSQTAILDAIREINIKVKP